MSVATAARHSGVAPAVEHAFEAAPNGCIVLDDQVAPPKSSRQRLRNSGTRGGRGLLIVCHTPACTVKAGCPDRLSGKPLGVAPKSPYTRQRVRPRSWFRTNDSGANRVANETGDVVQAKPPHDLGAVRLDGFHAQVQVARDALGGVTFGDELQNLSLARRERLGARGGGFRTPGVGR